MVGDTPVDEAVPATCVHALANDHQQSYKHCWHHSIRLQSIMAATVEMLKEEKLARSNVWADEGKYQLLGLSRNPFLGSNIVSPPVHRDGAAALAVQRTLRPCTFPVTEGGRFQLACLQRSRLRNRNDVASETIE